MTHTQITQSVDGSWTAAGHDGERGFVHPGFDTERDARRWAEARAGLPNKDTFRRIEHTERPEFDDSPLHGHNEPEGCAKQIGMAVLAGVIPALGVTAPWLWGWL